MWIRFYQDQIIISENDVSQYDSYIDFNSEKNFFYRLLNICIIQAHPNVEVVDEYVKSMYTFIAWKI